MNSREMRVTCKCPQALKIPDVCGRMLTYAHVCSRMLTSADVCWSRLVPTRGSRMYMSTGTRRSQSACPLPTYAHVRSRMLTYAHIRVGVGCTCRQARADPRAHVLCSRMLTYAHIRSRMLTCAQVDRASRSARPLRQAHVYTCGTSRRRRKRRRSRFEGAGRGNSNCLFVPSRSVHLLYW
jgi:hypothetical protein